MTQISHLKVLRYPELLTGPLRPMHWDVDPSSVCDHRCRGCPYIYDGAEDGIGDPMLGVVRLAMAKKNRGFLDYPAFTRFLCEAKEHGCRAITFVGGGEPTLHPLFASMCNLTHEVGIKFGIITHLGHEYDLYDIAAMSKAAWIRVSLNAATAETYEQHQGRNHFNQAVANMAELSQRGPHVGASFLITNDNYTEIAQAASTVHLFGAAYIQYKPIIETDLGAAYVGLEHKILDQLEAARRFDNLLDDGFQILDQWSGRMMQLIQHASGEFSGQCHVPRWNPKLGADGVVYTCCELAYSSDAALGSIYDEPLSTILERAAEKKIEQRACPHCWSKPINTAINENRLSDYVAPPESADQEFL